MKTLKNIVLGLLIVLVLLIVIGLFLPKNKHLESSVVIKAPTYLVFDQVNDLKNWAKWSPWSIRDTQMVTTYEGPSSGVSAVSKWTSPNKNTGSGSMTISASEPYKSIGIDLNFMGKGKSFSPWKFEETPEGLKVTWGLDISKMNLMERYFGLFMNKMMGPYFKQGLDSLKSVSEKLAVKNPGSMSVIEVKEVKAQPAFSITDSCTMMDMSKKMGELYSELMVYSEVKKVKQAGAPYAIYHTYNPRGYTRLEAGIPIEKPVTGRGRIKATNSPSGKAVTASYFGPYSEMILPYEIIQKYIRDNKLQITGGPWETYVTDPMTVKDSMKWETQISFPVK